MNSEETKITRYLYDNEDIIMEYDGAGKAVNKYLHGPGIDEPLAMERGGKMYYYHADGLGSIVALTDGTGKTAQAYEYDAFGRLHDRMNAIRQPYAFTGREWDKETGLYYYRARYYDAETGRFTTKDPIGFRGGVNLYGYVGGNPVNFKDPAGLQAELLVAGWGIAVAEPTPVGEVIMIGVTIGFGLYNIFNPPIAPVIPFVPPGQCKKDDKCEVQAQADEAICRSLNDPSARARCWASANERYGACRAGKFLPPLITW